MKNLKTYLFSKELLLIRDGTLVDNVKDFQDLLISVESKFTKNEFSRLLKLLEAMSIPTEITLLRKVIKVIIDVHKSFFPFALDNNFKKRVKSDLIILETFLTYLPKSFFSDFDLLLKPKKRFKLSFLLLTDFHIDIKEREKIEYVNVITFLLFQYQLITQNKLYKSSIETLIKMKCTGVFNSLQFKDTDEFFNAIIRDFKSNDCKYDKQDDEFHSFVSDSVYIQNNQNEEVESATNLYTGNRLSLPERMLLPYRSNCLKPHQISPLIDELISGTESNKLEIKIKSLFTLLSLITSKPDKYIQNLIISSARLVEPDFDYICIEDQCWYRCDVKLASAITPTEEHKKFLNKHSNVVALTLPISLIEAAKQILQKQNVLIGRLIEFLAYSSISGGNFGYKGKLTDAAIRSTMYSLLANNTDPNFAALVLSNTEYVEPTHLYYLSAKHSDIQRQFYAALSHINLPICKKKKAIHESISCGSKLPINTEKVKENISLIVKNVFHNIAYSGDEISKVINSHNMLSCYTVFMLSAVTGHRPRKTFSFSRYTIFNDKILISDKVDNKHSAIRILTLPELVQQQIDSYLNHCKKITKYLDKSHAILKKQLILIGSDRNSGVNDFSIINKNFELVGIGNKELSEFLSHGICLPDNFFRHILASFYRTTSLGKSAQEKLGHVRDGEHNFVANSPIALNDSTDDLKGALLSYLSLLGFELIKVDKLKGSFQKYVPIVKTYKPFKYKKKSISAKALHRWIINEINIGLDDLNLNQGDLVQENMDLIRPIIIDINDKIPYRWHKSEERKIASKILHKLYEKVNSGKKIISRYRLDTGLKINNDLINNLKQATLIKEEIEKLVKENVSDKFRFFQLILSIIINTNRKLNFTPSLLNAIQGKWSNYNGLCWLDWTENSVNSRLIVDSISVSLKNRLSNYHEREIDNFFENLKKRLEKKQEINIDILNKLNNINELSEFLSLSFESFIPSTLRYYRSQLLDCSCLSNSAMLHFYSNEDINDIQQLPLKNKRDNSNLVKLDNDSENLLKDLRENLNALNQTNGNKTKEVLTNTILTVWGRWVNSTSLDESILIKESQNITVACYSVLLWLIDVSKRPGKNRKTMSIGTLTTYLSNVAPSIISAAMDDDIFDYNQLSFVALYTKALSIKNVENEELRKVSFKDFHNSLLSRGFVVDLNWNDVVAQDYIGYERYNRNIITMNEYEGALKLLDEDTCSSKEQRRVNKLCLIFCYRLAMRWDDFSGLIINDVDLENMLISVRSNKYRRVKSTNSNRILPYELLLSKAEQDLLIEQIVFLHKILKTEVNTLLSSTKVFISQSQNLASKNEIYNRVTEAIKISTNNPDSSLHDCRRSFCSYMFLILNYSECRPFYTNQISQWCRNYDVLGFAQNIRNSFTGTCDLSNKIMPALALFVGHGTAETTAKYYIHLYDLLLHQYNESQIERKYSIKFIAENLNLRGDLARQTIKRNSKLKSINSNFQSLVSKANLNNAHFLSTTIEKADSQISLKTLSKKETKISIFNELLDIHEKVQIIHERFSIDERIKDIVITIKAKTKYDGVQYPIEKDELFYGIGFDFQHKDNKTKNYINDNLFILLCDTYDQLKVNNKTNLSELINAWKQLYHPKLNLIVEKGAVQAHIRGEIDSGSLSHHTHHYKNIICLNDFIKESGLSLLVRYKNQTKKSNSLISSGVIISSSKELQRVNYDNQYHKVDNGITKTLYEQLDLRYPNKSKSVAKKFNYFMLLLAIYKMINNYENEEELIKFEQRNNRYI